MKKKETDRRNSYQSLKLCHFANLTSQNLGFCGFLGSIVVLVIAVIVIVGGTLVNDM